MSGSNLILLGGSPKKAAVDPYFYSVTSLLHGDGTNGAQNNTFLDSSTNNFTITRNGNTTQGSFSPFSQTGWGGYFDGATATRLTMPSNTAFAFGTGAYTVEAWVYLSAHAATQTTVVDCGAATNSLNFSVLSTGALSLGVFGVGPTLSSAGGAVTLNTWNHVAVVRESTASNATKLYVNGTAVATGTDAGNYTVTTTPSIGGLNSSGFTATGYISNVRLVKGTAVYTAAFTPPTAPLTAITNTSLLTCQANRFLDASTNAFAVTANNGVSVQPFSPFNPTTPYSTSAVGGSGYFDGSGDYLTVADNAALEMGSSNFTIECWFYPLSLPADALIADFGSQGAQASLIPFYCQSSSVVYYISSGGAWNIASGVSFGGTLRIGQWHHLALVRSGSTFTPYFNGVAGTTTTNASAINDAAVNKFIGSATTGTAAINGYISNFRVVKGTAVYTSAFTPPTAPLTAITNTSLLTNFTNAGIFDNAADADYETVGNAQISTSVKKYGTGSMSFDGTGDYLLTNTTPNLMAFGTGDFTLECWAYATSLPASTVIFIDYRPSGTEGLYPTIYFDSGVIKYFTNSADRITGIALSVNTWYHIALCRVAGQTRLFVNGTQVGSTYADTNNYLAGSQRPAIGTWGKTLGSNSYTGYIDDYRISLGIGRYPYNFTPPTAEFPNIGGTVTLTADPYFDYTTLLLPGNGTNGAQNNTFLDSSTNAFSITRNGNTTQGTFSPFSQTGWGNYFDGSGDYLSVADNAALDLGTGDFTIECWVYPITGISNVDGLIGKRNQGTFNSGDWRIAYISASTSFGIACGQDNVDRTTPSINLNAWNHVAFVRSSGTLSCYANGLRNANLAWAHNLDNAEALLIGLNVATYDLPGYISNVRIVKGTAVYSGATYTVPTAPLTAITNTSLLTCQSNRFVDNSSNAFAITRNGDVSVQAFSPFNPTAAWSAATYGGSGYFDGSGDYLETTSSQIIPSGNFTIEAWAYITSSSSTQTIVAQGTGVGDGARTWMGIENSSGAKWAVQVGGTQAISSVTPVLNAWHYLAMVYNGSTIKMYLNGTEIASASSTTNASNTTLKIGTNWGSYITTGFISNIRISNTARTISAVPSSLLTTDANTVFLANFTNAGIYDATSKNDLETVGNAQISTTQSKFGGSSMYFDGTGDWLAIPASQNFAFGTGDFTIEGWVYISALDAVNAKGILQQGTSLFPTSVSNTVALGVNPAATWAIYAKNAATNSTATATLNSWTHFALVRFGTTTTLYANGISVITVSADSTNYTGTFFGVGSIYGTSGTNYNGYIDDLRITKGIARYTSNFTPPTTAFLTL